MQRKYEHKCNSYTPFTLNICIVFINTYSTPLNNLNTFSQAKTHSYLQTNVGILQKLYFTYHHMYFVKYISLHCV